jgi:hypothetical protein
MKTSWVLCQTIRSDFADPAVIRTVGPAWGSWETWKEYKTDNVVCTDLNQAKTLIQRAFHAVANFYVPKDFYATLGRPTGLRLYDGEFKGAAIKNRDDIVALNLTASTSDIVLLLGFKLAPISSTADKLEKTYEEAYQYNIRGIIRDNPSVQFVLVNYEYDLAPVFTELENLTLDSLDSVVELLV